MARPREHVIETLSRRVVAATLPAESFVEREQTERDYGIDMALEHFADGEPSGRVLLLQLKGTDRPAPTEDETAITFQAEVKALARCERFATPILLVWVPVTDPEGRSWFLWVQSYLRVVLEREKPGWRSQKTVRLHIPTSNLLGAPSNEGRLVHIAGEPARASAFGQLSRLAHSARWNTDDANTLAEIFREALRLEPIFGDTSWDWGQLQRGMIERGLMACELALSGKDPTDAQLREIGWGVPEPIGADSWEYRWSLLASGAQHCAQLMSTAVATYYDDRLRYSMWEAAGDHDF